MLVVAVAVAIVVKPVLAFRREGLATTVPASDLICPSSRRILVCPRAPVEDEWCSRCSRPRPAHAGSVLARPGFFSAAEFLGGVASTPLDSTNWGTRPTGWAGGIPRSSAQAPPSISRKFSRTVLHPGIDKG